MPESGVRLTCANSSLSMLPQKRHLPPRFFTSSARCLRYHLFTLSLQADKALFTPYWKYLLFATKAVALRVTYVSGVWVIRHERAKLFSLKVVRATIRTHGKSLSRQMTHEIFTYLRNWGRLSLSCRDSLSLRRLQSDLISFEDLAAVPLYPGIVRGLILALHHAEPVEDSDSLVDGLEAHGRICSRKDCFSENSSGCTSIKCSNALSTSLPHGLHLCLYFMSASSLPGSS